MSGKAKSVKMVLFGIAVIVVLTACSDESAESGRTDQNENGNDSSESETVLEDTISEPVTLTFMSTWNDKLFEDRIKGFVEEKFPNVTMELIPTRADSEGLQEIFAADIMPDFIHVTTGFGPLHELDMLFPLDDLIEQYGVDLSIVREDSLQATRAMDPELENRLLALPIEEVAYGLFYNKTIFDEFGIDYPRDGMTWMRRSSWRET